MMLVVVGRCPMLLNRSPTATSENFQCARCVLLLTVIKVSGGVCRWFTLGLRLTPRFGLFVHLNGHENGRHRAFQTDLQRGSKHPPNLTLGLRGTYYWLFRLSRSKIHIEGSNKDETRNSPGIQRNQGTVRLRQRVYHALDAQGRATRGNLLGVPPVLHR